MVFKELIFNGFYFGRVWWPSKNSVLTVSILGGCAVLFKELIFNSFYFGRVWCSSKNSVLTVSTLDRCSGLQRTEF